MCFTKFSHVLRPILPVPNSKMFLSVTLSMVFKMYCTEAKETLVAPEEISVSVLIRLLACITELTRRSINGFNNPCDLEATVLFLSCPIISKSPNI